MKNRIKNWRRQRALAAFGRNGKALREAEYARNSIDAAIWPDDAAYLDAKIDRLAAQRRAMHSKLTQEV